MQVTPTRYTQFPLTEEPIVPTATATTELISIATQTPSPSITPSPVVTHPLPTLTPTPVTQNWLPDVARFGVIGGRQHIEGLMQLGLPIQQYVNWRVGASLPDADFWQMVRYRDGAWVYDLETVATAVARNPSSVWIVGNEMDVRWQDNQTPQEFAETYHTVYTLIKGLDPTAQVAVGGISQPTPLRLAYLDEVLLAYETMYGEPLPADIWTVHGFILREEQDSWGIGIPPSFTEQSGMLYELDQHDDLALFQAQLVAFREWMARNGYRERPLALTEYGILMPAEYGFPPEAMAEFMVGSFDWLLTATDEEVGFPADDNRLVQWWFWFPAYDHPTGYSTGNLYDAETGALTSLGQVYKDYVDSLVEE